MTRVSVLLLCVLVGCALSLVASRHQARSLTVELEREQARARQFDVEYGQLSLEQSTWGMPARVEKIARESLRMQLPRHRAWKSSKRRKDTRRRRPEPRRESTVAPPAELPRSRASLLFGGLAALFTVLLGRSLWLQWIENDFLQGQGAARFSREIEVPAHRGRILDRNGEPSRYRRR